MKSTSGIREKFREKTEMKKERGD